jgi:uncharacterized membrane protein
MKRIIVFFRSSLLTGLLILLPAGLFYLTLQELFGLAIVMMKPVAEALFPADFGGFESPVLLAIGLLVASSLLLGLLARSKFVSRLGRRAEVKTLYPLPGYLPIKRLIQSFGNLDQIERVQPIIHGDPQVSRRIGYLMEEHADGYATVLFPWSPTSMAGYVEILPRSSLTLLDASLVQTNKALSFWGVGLRELMAERFRAGKD